MKQPDKGGTPKVLLVDDDLYLLAAFQQTLNMNGYDADVADKSTKALEMVAGGDYLVVLSDVKMPTMNGLELLERICEKDSELPVIMITGHGDVNMAVTAMKNGAYDFLEKPVDEAVLLASISRAVEKMLLVVENRRLSLELKNSGTRRSSFHGFMGRHTLMQHLYELIEIVARERDPVMICGETGTGKELTARSIHALSDHQDEPFVAVNMGAIPMEMLEAELFGYEKGAFTGAHQSRIGKFEYAGQGTLFLDEICSLPIHLQSKLLRSLDDQTIIRLGSNRSIPVRARIITATNRDLALEIKNGKFRQDLYYRLNVLPIEIPPIRRRRSDIPLLVEYFREEYCLDSGQESEPFTFDVISRMMQREWPGNVRELRNVVRRFCIFGSQDSLMISKSRETDETTPDVSGEPLKQMMAKVEKEHILIALRRHNGLVSEAFKTLGISRKALYDKIKKYDIDIDSFRRN